ncbi:MAG: PAS domain S-box protein [Pseudomonadota bacterium]
MLLAQQDRAHESYEFLQALLDALPQQIAVIDATGDILAVNQAWIDFANENRGQLAATDHFVNYLNTCSAAAAAGDRDADEAFHGISEVLAGQLDHFELTYPCHSPEEQRWFSMQVRPINSDGRANFIVLHTNVTENKLLEDGLKRESAAVREKEALLVSLLDNSPNPISLKDTDRRFLYVNRAFEETFEVNSDQILGQRLSPVFTQYHSAAADVLDDDVIRTGEVRSEERAFPKSAGRLFEYVATKFPIKDAKNRITGVGTILTNAAAIKQLEHRFTAAFESMTSANVLFDQLGNIESINGVAEQIFGYTREELIGQEVGKLLPAEDREHHVRRLRAHVHSDAGDFTGVSREVSGLRKNGEIFPMQIGIGEMTVGGRKAFIGSISDLTDLRRLEKQLFQAQRMEAVGQLTGGVAHDFNNLMATVLGNAELLERVLGVHECVHSYVRPIVQAVDRGAALTQRLLAFARQQALSPVAADVAKRIDGMGEILSRALGGSIGLRIDRPATLWTVMVDPAQFETALLNLAFNARDAMPSGGRLEIEAENVAFAEDGIAGAGERKAGEYVRIDVSDSGTGIPESAIAHVFEPFFTTKETGKGNGLGLSMVYGFVKQSGGEISVASSEGEGTTVSLFLPRATTYTEEDVPGADTHGYQQGTGRILVLEDDKDVRAVAVSVLKEHGYQVREASNGPWALELMRAEAPFDLLFTDIALPGGMSGGQVASKARELQPALQVIYTTGYAHDALTRDDILEVDAKILRKPYRQFELLEIIANMLVSD